MKLSQLKTIVKEAVKEAIQEELKEILLEAVKSPKSVIKESPVSSPKIKKSQQEIREYYKNILGETAANFNTSQFSGPLKVGSGDTTSPNGSLPEGNVSMDQIMGLMNGGK